MTIVNEFYEKGEHIKIDLSKLVSYSKEHLSFATVPPIYAPTTHPQNKKPIPGLVRNKHITTLKREPDFWYTKANKNNSASVPNK